ncbi:MAG TPA: ACT domain-containing protein [Thermodesulfobacteriota bacterium]|jgi:glycine cleavage system transcriptional repressor|nr:ACT domain-containing protein [Thermodesulfobacteriota bacterium]
MKRFFVITSIGKDRPGIVAGVSKVLFDLGVNIEDSSMTILRSEFAMILIISTKEGFQVSDLENHLKGLADRMGLSISVGEIDEEEVYSKKPYSGTPYIISVIGTDKPGIVYRVADLLSSKGINITDLNTKVIPGEKTPVYTMIIEVDVPGYVDMALLEEEFSLLEKEMGIDIDIKEIEVLEL